MLKDFWNWNKVLGSIIIEIIQIFFTVLPRSRGKYSPSVEKKNPGKETKEQPFYEVKPSVFVPRVPFVKARVK